MKLNSSDIKIILFSLFVFILQAVVQSLPVALITFMLGGVCLACMHGYDQKKYNDFKSRLDEASLKNKELFVKIQEQKKALEKY